MANRGLTKAQRAARQAKSAALEKAYKAKASALKKAGVLSSKVDARKKITRATKTKINKFSDVLEGKYLPVRATRDVREKYAHNFETRGPFILVEPERKGQRSKIRKGVLENIVPITDKITGLETGQWSKIVLPHKPADMQQLLEDLRNDPTLDGLKHPDEMFTFQLDGWNTEHAAVDAEELATIIERNYRHLFETDKGKPSPASSKSAVKALILYRFKSNRGTGKIVPDHEHFGLKNKKGFGKGREEDRYQEERKRQRNAEKQRQRRTRETPEETAKRRETERLRWIRNNR